jgi:PST family polysaccharide transporter
MDDIKGKAIRGGAAKVGSQIALLTMRMGSLMVMARLLDPNDYGLVGMVTASTGFLRLFHDFGLSAAAVQRVKISEEQASNLFWINVLVGATLSLLMVAAAPLIAMFYREPRLVWITVVLASGFVINAAGVQHSALLQRQMRFTTLAGIEVFSLSLSVIVGVLMAMSGYRYWAIVANSLVLTVVSTACLWLFSNWIPGLPHRGRDTRSMLQFGGTLTINGIVTYLSSNVDRILLGRWGGPVAVGLYGRAFQLINIPTDNINVAAGEVAFSTLSHLQDDRERLKRYFLKGYSLVLAITVPITIACALFAEDLIAVVLGPKWTGTVVLFRLLCPTILILGIFNPLGWLLMSLGMVGRSLRVDLLLAPVIIIGCAAGLSHGAAGVALGYSSALILWFIPHIALCVRGTNVSVLEVLRTASRPVLSGLLGAVVALSVQVRVGDTLSPLLRLLLSSGVMFSVYALMLLSVFRQKDVYVDLLRNRKEIGRVEREVLFAYEREAPMP